MKSIKTVGNLSLVDDFSVQDMTATNATITNLNSSTATLTNLNISGTVIGGTFPSAEQSVPVDLFDNSGLSWQDTAQPSTYEFGLSFVPNANIAVSAFRIYHSANMTATSRTIRLWNNSGTLVTSANTSAEGMGWNTTASFNKITLTKGATYTISATVDPGLGGGTGYIPISSSAPGYPQTYNGVTITAGLYGTLAGSMPTTSLGISNIVGLDLYFVFNTVSLSAVGTESSSSGSTGASSTQTSRIIWATCTPNGTNGTVAINSASTGISSVTRTSTGITVINFTQPFLYLPSVNVNIVTVSANATPYIAYVGTLTTSSVQILTLEPGVAWYDLQYCVQIIGI